MPKTNNFDLIRLAAALQVAFIHAVADLGVAAPWPLRPIAEWFPGVPIFFFISGFLISKSFEKEDNLKYEAEAALGIGKAALNFNPATLPNTSFVQIMTGKTLQAADGQSIDGMSVNLYVGPTGSTSGQFGRFASIVAEARDVR